MRRAILVLVLAALAACANGVKQKTTDDNLPTCMTLADCKAHDGKRVHVVGVYTIFNVAPSRPLDKETAPVRIALTDEMGPFLAAYWHQDAARPQDEKARLEGMPPNPDPRAASMGGPCIHPIDDIAVSD